jgi:two-component system response regulator VicR
MKKIMVVDDDPDQISTIKYVLENSDNQYEVISANNGIQCLQLLENNLIPDVILLDIMMPEMNGWEVFKHLKERSPWNNIPIIFLTARTDGIAKNAGGFLGDDYIEKPFNGEDLIKRIDDVLKKR